MTLCSTSWMIAFFTDVDKVEAELNQNQNRPIDDVQMDDMKAYRQKMSRWVKASFEAVKTPGFWVMLRLVESAKATLDHCLHALESKPSAAEKKSGRTVLSSLVCGKAQLMSNEFGDVLADTAKWDLETASLVSITPSQMVAALVALTLTGACECDIRVLSRLISFPYLWLVMVQQPPDVACKERARCAQFLVDCNPESIDVSTFKLVQAWTDYLMLCQGSGTLSTHIYWILYAFRAEFESTVQAVEGPFVESSS